MNIKKVFQNAAFRIVENNLKVTHINMLQRSEDVIENELLNMASQSRGDENYIMTLSPIWKNGVFSMKTGRRTGSYSAGKRFTGAMWGIYVNGKVTGKFKKTS